MPKIILGPIISALLLTAPMAYAAPTCLDKKGDTVRCGSVGAMPVGWAPSPQMRWDRELSQPPTPGRGQVLEAVLVIGLLFALIALLPEFDGSATGWDKQEGDDNKQP